MTTPTRESCVELDVKDPLAGFRDDFVIPDGVIYLDGNSLGVLPAHTASRIEHVVTQEWGQGLIRSWNDAGWFDKPRTLGDRVGALVGAGPGQVVVCDSTSINLFKALAAALTLRPDRHAVVGDRDNFPTDLYMMEGATGSHHERRLISADGPTLADVLDEQVAVVVLTQVDYRTGRMYDMAAVTAQVQAAGALMIWDLSHSVGAVPVDLDGCGADFAVGCSYKYLNGGPGAPAFIYVASRHQDAATQPLAGWHGHARPFEFTDSYEPAPGITRFLVGTPPLLSYAGLEASLEIWDRVDMAALRAKSLALTDLFIELVESRVPDHVEVVTPRDHAVRGSQVSLRHEDGYAPMAALIERGVIGDFRAPDLMRFGFTPLYVGYADVWDAVDVLADVLESGVWREARFATRNAVT
ncbi:kynureninase [Nocardioides currus]|uniref:Kynureninase n=1 Tax=Nocardioides currus TaxID=2133958 RepID=A0A2R7Z021_9ACTN|nr:kynureninase [Nocardioides currus]PUA81509.1 kynureninase [Nocardioides currus]